MQSFRHSYEVLLWLFLGISTTEIEHSKICLKGLVSSYFRFFDFCVSRTPLRMNAGYVPENLEYLRRLYLCSGKCPVKPSDPFAFQSVELEILAKWNLLEKTLKHR